MFGNGKGGGHSLAASSAKGKGKYRRVPHNDFGDSDSDEADDFISLQIRNQKEQFKKQDEGLEMLSQSADRLGKLSLNIHEELGHQNRLLDEMEDDLDKATTQLNFVTQKTRDLVQKSGGKKNFLIIVGLTIVVIVLILLIIYT